MRELNINENIITDTVTGEVYRAKNAAAIDSLVAYIQEQENFDLELGLMLPPRNFVLRGNSLVRVRGNVVEKLGKLFSDSIASGEPVDNRSAQLIAEVLTAKVILDGSDRVPSAFAKSSAYIVYATGPSWMYQTSTLDLVSLEGKLLLRLNAFIRPDHGKDAFLVEVSESTPGIFFAFIRQRWGIFVEMGEEVAQYAYSEENCYVEQISFEQAYHSEVTSCMTGMSELVHWLKRHEHIYQAVGVFSEGKLIARTVVVSDRAGSIRGDAIRVYTGEFVKDFALINDLLREAGVRLQDEFRTHALVDLNLSSGMYLDNSKVFQKDGVWYREWDRAGGHIDELLSNNINQ
jgi:hypothetical protein